MQFVLRHFLEHRQEIGLHIDPLHVYFAHGIEGGDAVLTEAEWMRACGVALNGVVAHNSAPLYGAENFEIFEGFSLENRHRVTFNGVTADLQSIRMGHAKLTYEGNYPQPPDPTDRHLLNGYLAQMPEDALRRADWLSIYLKHNPVFSRPNDVSIWILGNDMWAIAECNPKSRFLFNIDHNDVIRYLERYNYEGRIIITIHPEYISKIV